MFQFYQELVSLRRSSCAIRSRHIDVIHVNPEGRVIAFTRRSGSDELLVLASFHNVPYLDGYTVHSDSSRLPTGGWRELFNSDQVRFGGDGVGNGDASIQVLGGCIHVRVPANALLVLRRL